MAASLSDMIDFVWKSPKPLPGTKRRALDRMLPENFKYFRTWGFRIYRTYYGPESDESWNTLLQVLPQQIRLALGYHEIDEVRGKDRRWARDTHRDEVVYLERLEVMKKLFRLIPREDPDLLAGLDIAGVGKVCLEEGEHVESEKNIVGSRFNFALVADERILKDIANNNFVVKAVGYDWDPVQHSYSWGWIRLRTGDLLQFWENLFISYELDISKYMEISFRGPEENLEKNVWKGALSLLPFGDCSRVQITREDEGSDSFKFDP
ncbi:hypothetical protein FVEN_g216 [Fusarium venenatum]|uniref:Uncharacterized protein n=1 Tax=Fusarium venenatum TaxID=56646 RepID=A0A2L2TT84_9HYPO|nr:uncharacterized protein FVRRES_07681 [Fusarium venenatum]KAG8361862.1 hypothetical protein FVEN_g216 [Fusarium venenatum]KAH6994580.1 hypothetical protein EDB82DRAFT_502103 [Fusarium venenatum]CEI63245.1 unnamed protein product [Fusarium venenatum]